MLAIRSILFAALGPGTVTVLIPWHLLHGARVESGPWGVLNYLGVAPMALGAGILLRCIWDFAVAGHGTLAPVDPPKELVVRGLYRYVRNPMYVGVMSILLGEALLFWSRALLVYAGIFFVTVNFFVLLYEERVLRRQFGESYESYRQKVNRWLPKTPHGTAG